MKLPLLSRYDPALAIRAWHALNLWAERHACTFPDQTRTPFLREAFGMYVHPTLAKTLCECGLPGEIISHVLPDRRRHGQPTLGQRLDELQLHLKPAASSCFEAAANLDVNSLDDMLALGGLRPRALTDGWTGPRSANRQQQIGYRGEVVEALDIAGRRRIAHLWLDFASMRSDLMMVKTLAWMLAEDDPDVVLGHGQKIRLGQMATAHAAESPVQDCRTKGPTSAGDTRGSLLELVAQCRMIAEGGQRDGRRSRVECDLGRLAAGEWIIRHALGFIISSCYVSSHSPIRRCRVPASIGCSGSETGHAPEVCGRFYVSWSPNARHCGAAGCQRVLRGMR